jgi:peptidoglycan DL-endopeptidase RipA
MRRQSIVIGFILAIVLSAIATPASADWYFARTSPAVIFCYEKVDAYGGLYMIRTGVLNNTTTTQTGVADFLRRNSNGTFTPQFSTTISSPPGVWKLGEPGYLSLYFNDRFKFKLNGSEIFGIDASAVPYYQYHCKVKYTGIPSVDSALGYGLAQLDAPYVGANNPYRFGTPGDGRTHQAPPQHKYLAPLGVSGFDCSGLVTMMYQHAGIVFNAEWKSSDGMERYFTPITAAQLRPGDLIVNGGSHVAVYLGDGDGDGVASVLEATPSSANSPEGQVFVKGVVINNASKYLQANGTPIPGNGYVLRRVPGL